MCRMNLSYDVIMVICQLGLGSFKKRGSIIYLMYAVRDIYLVAVLVDELEDSLYDGLGALVLQQDEMKEMIV